MTGNELLQEAGSILNFDPTDTAMPAFEKNKVIRAINMAKNRLLAQIKYANIKTSTFSTVASQLLYNPFDDLQKVLMLRQTTTDKVLTPWTFQRFYDTYPDPTTEGTPELYFPAETTNGGLAQFGLYPIPSAIITMNIMYRALVKNITGVADYVTGTVTATNASATIAGSGTSFTSAMVGRYIRLDSNQIWYKITAYTSATSITIGTAYQGTTSSGAAYTISEKFFIDGQDDTFDDLVALKAKHLLMENNIQYIELMLELDRDLQKGITDYKAKMIQKLDSQNMLRPRKTGRSYRIADLESTDIFNYI